MTKKTCYQYSIDLLARRDYSKHKLSQKLRQREFSESEIDETIETLVEKNYLREEEYARMRVQGLLYKGYSNSYIQQKCAQEKLSVEEEFIDEIRLERGLGAETEIMRLIDKKMRGKEMPETYVEKMKIRNKVTHFLASKGHRFPEIKKALEEYFNKGS